MHFVVWGMVSVCKLYLSVACNIEYVVGLGSIGFDWLLRTQGVTPRCISAQSYAY